MRDCLAPELSSHVLLTARILGDPGHKGGRVNWARLQKDLRLILKSDPSAFCTTLLDYYGLQSGFPGDSDRTGAERAADIELGMKNELVRSEPTLRVELRFIPYLQLHEYEGLLFSDPEALADAIGVPSLSLEFAAIRSQFTTPEEINDAWATAPSKRILQHHPRYQKVIEGTLAAGRVTVAKMREECPRFHRWLSTLESLPVL